MRVIEIFDSIDGEGLRAGELATFIRLAGCNLKCSYCDTAYSIPMDSGEEMTIPHILEVVRHIGNKNITLTGGEPLLHEEGFELANALSDAGYRVNVETNGSIDIRFVGIDSLITMDWKAPSSGMEAAMKASNLEKLTEKDVLKLVIAKSDFDYVADFLRQHRLPCYIYLSPVFGQVEPKELVEFAKHLREIGVDTSKLRVQLQLHKFIWPVDMRGV